MGQSFVVVSDIHAEDRRLERVLSWSREQGVEGVLCPGDLVDGVGDPGRCIELLQEAEALVVRGNHDRWILEGTLRRLHDATPQEALSEAQLQYLKSLPTTLELQCSRGRILLCHGVGDDDMCRLTPDDRGYALASKTPLQKLLQDRRYALMLHGHTHQAMARRFGQMVALNPGALTDRSCEYPGFALLDVEAFSARFYRLTPEQILPVEEIRFDDLTKEW